jgi:hypothetical protein
MKTQLWHNVEYPVEIPRKNTNICSKSFIRCEWSEELFSVSVCLNLMICVPLWSDKVIIVLHCEVSRELIFSCSVFNDLRHFMVGQSHDSCALLSV